MTSGLGSGRVAVATGVWLGTLALLFILWTGEWTATDWIGAGVCALVAAATTIPMTRMGLFDLKARFRWLGMLPAAVRQIFTDFAIVTAFLGRALIRGDRSGGAFVARSNFPVGPADAEGTTWRAFVGITATVSPNSYVVDIHHENGNRLSHDLVPHRPSEAPA